MADKSQKTQKKSRVKELSNEFKKIVWPDKMTLAKQTAAVVAVSVILGGLIAIIDFVLKYGVDLLVNLKLG
ncbi:preprotein translocase subunit SecE [Lachnospiraceae bacterium PF1-22]|uniref:preprotein translocase subunit SecE n=1 Tax=Ohessyouella blattaphilus TaxID=2949333 RepID=UPI003E1DDCA8